MLYSSNACVRTVYVVLLVHLAINCWLFRVLVLMHGVCQYAIYILLLIHGLIDTGGSERVCQWSCA